MTTPTLTCEHCESEIDVAKEPKCVSYDASGVTDVVCEACRERAWKRWMESAEDAPADRAMRAAYRIKRGWGA